MSQVGLSALLGRFDLTSYEGITTARSLMLEQYLNGSLTEGQQRAINATLDKARHDLDARLKYIRPTMPIAENTLHPKVTTSPIQEEEDDEDDEDDEDKAVNYEQHITADGPFGLFKKSL